MADERLVEALLALRDVAAARAAVVAELPVSRARRVQDVRALIASELGASVARSCEPVLRSVLDLLESHTIHVAHPRYFGLFNPAVTPESVVAEAVVALVNPQLAVWQHSPAAQEIERLALHRLAQRIGYRSDEVTANFTSGGQESNATAVVSALAHAFPGFGDTGLRGLTAEPRLYLSEHGHDSFDKIAGSMGLGRVAVRRIAVDACFRMRPDDLERCVVADQASGCAPFMVVGTAGTTGTGVIDPLPELADIAERHGAWFHVDAAWGGGALLSDALAHHLRGIDRAHSVTWDAHKWLSVPLGAGMFFSRCRDAARGPFAVQAKYVPPMDDEATDPYVSTMQWSRRFIGLRVFLALATRGIEGYAELIEHQTAMGARLREALHAAGWRLRNQTPLPLVCFDRPELGPQGSARIVELLNESGDAWMSTIPLGDGSDAIRACICSYRTQDADIGTTVDALERCRVRAAR